MIPPEVFRPVYALTPLRDGLFYTAQPPLGLFLHVLIIVPSGFLG